MRLPILAYGHAILREQCNDIDHDFPALDNLIENMWETMILANGCGLAAPQVGHAMKLFIVDSKTTYDNLEEEERDGYFAPDDTGIVETFINAIITDRSDDTWEDNEGCLSIPGLSQGVERSQTITIEYLDRSLEKQVKTFSGATARMIQHEYDHTLGILYLDYLSPLTRKRLESKLRRIAHGDVKVKYLMKFV